MCLSLTGLGWGLLSYECERKKQRAEAGHGQQDAHQVGLSLSPFWSPHPGSAGDVKAERDTPASTTSAPQPSQPLELRSSFAMICSAKTPGCPGLWTLEVVCSQECSLSRGVYGRLHLLSWDRRDSLHPSRTASVQFMQR